MVVAMTPHIQMFELATKCTIIPTMSSRDWTLISALSGVAGLAGVVGYGSFILIHSRPEPTREYQSSTVLIPAHDERPKVNLTAPSAEHAQNSLIERIEIFDAAEPAQSPSHIETAVPVKSMDPALSERMESRSDPPPPTGDYGSSAHNSAKSPPQIGSKAGDTSKANYFNFPIVLGVGY